MKKKERCPYIAQRRWIDHIRLQKVLDGLDSTKCQPLMECTIFGYLFQSPYFITQVWRVMFLIHWMNRSTVSLVVLSLDFAKNRQNFELKLSFQLTLSTVILDHKSFASSFSNPRFSRNLLHRSST